MTCALAQWKDPFFASSLPGLVWNGKKFDIDHDFFDCCEGRGLRWDGAQELARSCKLQYRKRKVDLLSQKFEALYSGAEFPKELSLLDLKFFADWLTRFEKQRMRQGYLASCKRDGGSPGSFWRLALMTTWRFGISSHVFCIGRSKEQDMIPFELAADEYPLVYFLDSVNELWKPRYKEQVSTIINWCEQSEVPLWIEIREAPPVKDATRTSLDLRESFRSYISKMKSRPVLDWLDEECLYRLLRVSSQGAPVSFLKEFGNARMDT